MSSWFSFRPFQWNSLENCDKRKEGGASIIHLYEHVATSRERVKKGFLNRPHTKITMKSMNWSYNGLHSHASMIELPCMNTYSNGSNKNQTHPVYFPGPERLLSINLLFVKQIHHYGKKKVSTFCTYSIRKPASHKLTHTLTSKVQTFLKGDQFPVTRIWLYLAGLVLAPKHFLNKPLP